MPTTENPGLPGRPSQSARAAVRLPAVDFLRGLALVIVLLDHVEWWLPRRSLFQNWTLMGLGFSDAADAFVALSGFTYGWVYTVRIGREGLLSGLGRSARRGVQIYVGFLATVLVLLTIALVFGEPLISSAWNMRVTSLVTAGEAFRQALGLGFQPLGLGILCMYAVILPGMPLLLALSQRGWHWLTIGLSASIYVAAQPSIGLSPSGTIGLHGWTFNPFAWQFLFVLAMVCGDRGRRGGRIVPSSGWWTVAATLVVLFSLFVKKVDLLFPPDLVARQPMLEAIFEPSNSWLLANTNLGPLRLLHFAALAHLTARCLPRDDSAWRHACAAPLIACGRHSLPVYCTGTVLAYACGYLFERFGGATWIVAAIALDACLVQVLFAVWLDRRVPKGPRRLVTPSPSGTVEPVQSS